MRVAAVQRWSCLLWLLVLPGCVTADLWGHRCRMRGSGADRWLAFEPKRFTEWQWWRVAARVVATPATVGLDLVTLPVQGLAVGGAAQAR